MAYKYEDLEKKALEVIKKKKTPFISHLVAYMPISKSTFYEVGLHESDAIADAIEAQKVSMKTKLLVKMMDYPQTYEKLYKLLSDDKEFDKLSGQKVDHTTNGKDINVNIVKSY